MNKNYLKQTISHYYKGNIIDGLLTEELNERAHHFSQQYEISEYISGFCVEVLKLNKNNIELDLSKFGINFKTILVDIHRDNLLPGISGKVIYTSNDGKILLRLYVYKHYSTYYNTEHELYLDIVNVIAHELMHSFISIQVNNDNDVEYKNIIDIPKYYNDYLLIMDNQDVSEETYTLIYALYLLCYQEAQAFTSEVYGEINKYLSKCDKLDNETFKNALGNSNIINMVNTISFKLNELDKNNHIKQIIVDEINSNTKEFKINDIKQLTKLINNTIYNLKLLKNNIVNCAIDRFYRK